MLNYIRHFFTLFFQKRQLLLRQNGEVGMITLSSWLQVTLLILFISTMIWLTVVSFAFFENRDIITTLNISKQTESQQWQQEKNQLELQLQQQQNHLNELKEKQLVLHSLIEALPTKSVDNETKTPQKLSDPSPQTQFIQDKNHVHQLQEYLLSMLDRKISDRTSSINQTLNEVGIHYSTNNRQAQGGPFHGFAIDQLPEHYIDTIDKLVRLNELEQLIMYLPSSMPVAKDDYYISSPFGFRKDPFTGRRAFHKGVDLAGWHKTAIIAPATGVVLRAGNNGGYGKFIELQHPNGITTRFGHLHTIKVKRGQHINKGDVIALM